MLYILGYTMNLFSRILFKIKYFYRFHKRLDMNRFDDSICAFLHAHVNLEQFIYICHSCQRFTTENNADDDDDV